MEFEWDIKKAQANQSKHSVCFEDVSQDLHDPNRTDTFDGREDRWKTAGLV
ncbi:MAG: BrnT family toxin [Comamonadaceae bacterium]|nr:BrnT family toxin [Comamonadaceae bacterium]